MSPVNPAVGRIPNPPLPIQPLVVPQSQVEDHTPQRQISAVSQLSAVPPATVPLTDEPGLRVLSVDGGNVVSGAVVPQTPSPQITPERQKTPESHVHENKAAPVESLIHSVGRRSPPSSPPSQVAERVAPLEPERPVVSLNTHDVPPQRTIPTAPVQQSEAGLGSSVPRDAIISPHEGSREAIITPPSPIDDDGTYKLSPPPVPTDGESSSANGVLGRQATIRQTSAEQFEEHKRKMLLAAQEEKIPVFPDEVIEEVPEPREEDRPQMSATSYPGQEWNPYGDPFAYDEEDGQ